MFAIQHPMSGEVHDTILRQRRAGGRFSASLEIECPHDIARGSCGRNSRGLHPTEQKASEVEAGLTSDVIECDIGNRLPGRDLTFHASSPDALIVLVEYRI